MSTEPDEACTGNFPGGESTDDRIRYPAWPPRDAWPHLSWSNLRIFNECERKWLFEYGADHLPEPLMWEIKKQHRLVPAQMFVGDVVHIVIDRALRRYPLHRNWPDLRREAREVVQEYVRFSRLWREAIQQRLSWPRHPIYRPIDRLYFGEPFQEEEKREMLARIDDALANFVASPLTREILEQDPKIWRLPEQRGRASIPWFWWGDLAVYASYDFAMVRPDETWIVDWKTGSRERGEPEAEHQLHYYAAFAIHHWSIPGEQIRLFAVWLSEGGECSEFLVAAERLEQMQTAWVERVAELRERVNAIEMNRAAPLDLFPITDDLWKCRGCPFRSCEGYRRLKAADLEAVWAGSDQIDDG